MTSTISGGDVHTPRAAATELGKIAGVYGDLLASIEQSRANQEAMGITGEPLNFLATMHDAAATVTAAATSAAAAARRHVQTVQDTVGSDPSLAGTQAGKYMDPAAV